MPIKFTKLTRSNMRNLKTGEILNEHGILFERLSNGDGRYTVNIMVDAQRIHRVIGKESDGTTRTQAEEFIEKAKQDAKAGRLNLPKGRKLILNFKEAAEKYLEKLKIEGGRNLKAKSSQLSQHLTPFFGEMPLSKISSFDVERYKKMRQEKPAKRTTINRELAILSHLFNKAIEWDWIDKRPAKIARFKEDQGRTVYLTTEQVTRLIEAAKQDQNPQVYLFITIGLGTSMRPMEILSIKLENIDLNRYVIYIPQAKAGAREQPVTAHLAEVLKKHLANVEADQIWLFPSAKTKTKHTVNIKKSYRRVVEAAGLDPTQIVRHTLRHTAITHLVQAGVDLPTVRRISGHKTLRMVERYSHQNGAHIQKAMDKLQQSYHGNKAVMPIDGQATK
jgi:integrase